VADEPLSASAHHFVTSDLDLEHAEDALIVGSHHLTRQHEVQKHAAEMVERDLTEVHLDAAQMGVGGVHSWGAIPPEGALLRPDHIHRLVFSVRPFGKKRPTGGSGGPAPASPAAGQSLAELSRLGTEAIEEDAATAESPTAFRCTFPGDPAWGSPAYYAARTNLSGVDDEAMVRISGFGARGRHHQRTKASRRRGRKKGGKS